MIGQMAPGRRTRINEAINYNQLIISNLLKRLDAKQLFMRIGFEPSIMNKITQTY